VSQEKWGPDVREVMAANREHCDHRQRGTCHRNVGAGWPMIGYRRESYYGCLFCERDLSGMKLAYEVFGKDTGLDFEAWVDQELARKSETLRMIE
jgi:hypothetical protein